MYLAVALALDRDAARAIAAIVILRDQVLIPCLAGARAAALARTRWHSRGATARLRPHGLTAA
jgi:hypothetical protein